MNVEHMSERINADMLLEKTLSEYSGETLLRVMHMAMIEVRKEHANANLCYVTDRRGKRTHVGIYVVPMELNYKRQFNAKQQYAPQRIGREMAYKDEWPEAAKRRLLCRMWCEAAYYLPQLPTPSSVTQ